MGGSRRTWVLASVLALLSAWYWSLVGDGGIERSPGGGAAEVVQTYLVNTRSLAFAEDGALAEVMEASRIEHFAADDVSSLQQPRFYSHDGNDRTWAAAAEQGELKHRTSMLLLSHNVVLSNDQSGGTLQAQAMALDLRLRTASSKVPVTAEMDGNVLQADGMFADLANETILLQPNVEGIYVPTGP
ncbi:MAG: LPS export ABC transporter periplasmic protein LptC [Haliea sp.]|uniref:LPS export ABC transporter periplasmic protein LptC n=1 Tax=Haliea sp. TaxID=1932666 RepID=UPI0032EBBA05